MYIKINRQPKNLQDLFVEFFSVQYQNRYFGARTFDDEKLTRVNCPERKFRSIDDIIALSKTYFPDASIEEILEALISTVIVNKEGEKYIFQPVHCYQILRPTVYFGTINDFGTLDLKTSLTPMSNSKFKNWGKALKLINITTLSQLKDRIFEKMKNYKKV